MTGMDAKDAGKPTEPLLYAELNDDKDAKRSAFYMKIIIVILLVVVVGGGLAVFLHKSTPSVIRESVFVPVPTPVSDETGVGASTRYTCGGGNAPYGSKCIFPFTYMFMTHNDCTTLGHSKEWCYTNNAQTQYADCCAVGQSPPTQTSPPVTTPAPVVVTSQPAVACWIEFTDEDGKTYKYTQSLDADIGKKRFKSFTQNSNCAALLFSEKDFGGDGHAYVGTHNIASDYPHGVGSYSIYDMNLRDDKSVKQPECAGSYTACNDSCKKTWTTTNPGTGGCLAKTGDSRSCAGGSCVGPSPCSAAQKTTADSCLKMGKTLIQDEGRCDSSKCKYHAMPCWENGVQHSNGPDDTYFIKCVPKNIRCEYDGFELWPNAIGVTSYDLVLQSDGSCPVAVSGVGTLSVLLLLFVMSLGSF